MDAKNKIDNTLCRIFRALAYFAGGIGALMMILSVANVIARAIFTAPLYGTVELVSYGGLLMGAFALAQNEISDGNIVMTLLTDYMKPKSGSLSLGFTSLLCAAFYAAITYKYFTETFVTIANHSATTTVMIPSYIINLIMFIGFAVATLAFLLKAVKRFAFIVTSDKTQQKRTDGAEDNVNGQ